MTPDWSNETQQSLQFLCTYHIYIFSIPLQKHTEGLKDKLYFY